MKVVIITGGIGSGKSLACRFLSDKFGWPVYHADERVKEFYMTSPSLLSDIETQLGAGFRDAAGNFLPSSLADVIFSDPAALEKVESLVFPCLAEDFAEWCAAHGDMPVVILESATILEKPQLKGIGDITVLIDAPIEMRLSRAVSRDGSGTDAIRRRMEAQRLMNDVSEGIAEAPADFVLKNDSTVDVLFEGLTKLAENII